MEIIVIDSDSDSESPEMSRRTSVAAVVPVVEEKSHFFETPEHDRPIPSIEVVQPWAALKALKEEDEDVKITEVRNITRRMSITAGGNFPSVTKTETPDLAQLPQTIQPLQLVEDNELIQNPQPLQLFNISRASQTSQVARTLSPRPQHPPSKKTNNPIFTFQKGRDGKGDVFFTVSQVVAGTSMSFRDLPDLPGADARKALRTLQHRFTKKSVLGALVYIDTDGVQHLLKTATSSNVGPGSQIFGGEAPSANLLWKPVWRKRVLKLAPMLKHQLGSIYDGAGKKGSGTSDDRYGSYNSAHVEKKLATFLVYMLMADFGIIRKDMFATCDDVRMLRNLIQADPRHMRFEILVSRKWCVSCASYVRKLRSASGVDMILRVQPVVQAAPPAVGRMVSEYVSDGEGEKYGDLTSGQSTFKDGPVQEDEIGAETFNDDELVANKEMDFDHVGEDDHNEKEEQARHSSVQDGEDSSPRPGEILGMPVRDNSAVSPSESRAFAAAQDEEGNELFCPLHPSPRPAPSPVVKEEENDAPGIDMVGVTLTQQEEAELFGSPEPSTDQSSNPMREDENLFSPSSSGTQPSITGEHERDLFSPVRAAKSGSPPLPVLPDEGDELFLPLYDKDHRRPRTSSPRAPSTVPDSPRQDWDVIVIEDTPPPPSAETIANFARMTAEHAYKPPPVVPRKPGPPMSIDVARERVFQKKPLPATPVTEEPFSPLEASFARDRAGPMLSRRQEWEQFQGGGDDPVFQQLEMEMEL